MMRNVWRLCKATIVLAATALVVSACGGGGAGGSSTTISGKAAAGAPIIGTVTIKDSSSPALAKTVSIEADGNYNIDVTGLEAPYMVRADGYVGGNEYHLYSAGTSADVGGTINITPLTDLIVANIAKTVASDYFNSNFASTLTTEALNTQTDALAAKLQPILAAVGVSGSIDLLRGSFNTDHTGIDAVLDIIRVSTDTTTNVATITNIITQEQMTSNISTGTYTGALTDTTGVATASTDIQLISAGFKKFSDLYATGLPSDTNATLLSLFDSATFLQEGEALAAFLTQITTDKSMIGISFTNISIKSMEMATNTALVGFDVIQYGKPTNDAPDTWHMIKKNGAWYMQGDQRIAHVKIKPRSEYRVAEVTDPIITGLNINIEDRGGKGITSAVVTGKGLASPVTMVNQINTEWFTIQGLTNGGNLYVMDDTQIGAIADSGEVYTIDLYAGSTKVATYTEKLKKRPYLNTELTAASFLTITSPTLSQLHAFTGGNATITWTLPAGLTNDWLEAQIGDSFGNYSRFEASLLPTDTSKSFTLNPVTSTGQAFTATQGWIWLSAWDGYGRQLATALW